MLAGLCLIGTVEHIKLKTKCKMKELCVSVISSLPFLNIICSPFLPKFRQCLQMYLEVRAKVGLKCAGS